MKENETKKEEKTEPETQNIQKADVKAKLVTTDTGEFSCYLDTAKFEQMYRVANVFAHSEIVPSQYRQKPSDCFIALQMAVRLGVEPFMFMQNTYVVQGTPGMEGKLCIALINKKGPFKGPVQWRFDGEGETRQCTAYATHAETGEVCEMTVTWKMVEAEGWNAKKGSKWLTMPDLMFQYRSATMLGRLYCPEVLMGMNTVDELLDINKPVPFEAAQKAAEQNIKAETASEPMDANFDEEPEPQEPKQEISEGKKPWDDIK